MLNDNGFAFFLFVWFFSSSDVFDCHFWCWLRKLPLFVIIQVKALRIAWMTSKWSIFHPILYLNNLFCSLWSGSSFVCVHSTNTINGRHPHGSIPLMRLQILFLLWLVCFLIRTCGGSTSGGAQLTSEENAHNCAKATKGQCEREVKEKRWAGEAKPNSWSDWMDSGNDLDLREGWSECKRRDTDDTDFQSQSGQSQFDRQRRLQKSVR